MPFEDAREITRRKKRSIKTGHKKKEKEIGSSQREDRKKIANETLSGTVKCDAQKNLIDPFPFSHSQLTTEGSSHAGSTAEERIRVRRVKKK